ncbi:MAG: hypothetical protein FWE32_01785 [Oscillospiraceae bacterium]|nr:hypothetical protein [Oscillospiraceae bacterium]
MLGSAPVAAANDDLPAYTPSNENLIVLRDIGAQSPRGAPGDTVRIVLPLAVNQEEVPTENFRLTNITIEPIITAEWPFDIINASYLRPLRDMSFNDTVNVSYDFRISQHAARSVYPINFAISATVWRDHGAFGANIWENVTFIVGVHVTVTEYGSAVFPPAAAAGGPLQVAGTTDGRGIIPTPSGRPGELITMHIPVVNMGGALTDITVTPVISSDVEEFPFVTQHLNYGRNLADMANGAQVTLDFSFRISPYATSGVKIISFHALHRENGVLRESTFNAHIIIEDGFIDPGVVSVPIVVNRAELLIDGRPVSHLMAGESAVLRVYVINHSDYDTVYNVAAAVAIATANHNALTLTPGYSDTAFAQSIDPGEAGEIDFNISARAAAPVGPVPVTVHLRFVDAHFESDEISQVLMVSVAQPTRLVVDEPIVFGQQRVNAPIAVNISAVNMGRATLYNLVITAGENNSAISMYESFFGGDLIPAGTLSADIQVISGQTGGFTGTLFLNFEDSEGQTYSQMIELPLNISAPAPALPEPPPPPPSPTFGPVDLGNPRAADYFAGFLTLLGTGSGIWYLLKIRGRRLT